MPNIADDCRLSRKQERAILELLNPSNRTLTDIANKVGISERTLRYWQNLPIFQKRLAQERKNLLNQGLEILKGNFTNACFVLGELLNDKSPIIRLRSCQIILEHISKLLEQKKDNRLQHPFDAYLEDYNTGEVAGGMSLHDKFLRLKEITARSIERKRDEIQREEKEKRDSHAIDLKDF